MESKMECILASIFDGFWSVFGGGKLGWKVDQNRFKKASKNDAKMNGAKMAKKGATRGPNWP